MVALLLQELLSQAGSYFKCVGLWLSQGEEYLQFFPREEMYLHGREGISATELEGDLEPALDSSWIGHLGLDGCLLLN